MSSSGRSGRRTWVAATLVAGVCAGAALADNTERVSVSSSEVQDNSGFSNATYVTPNGRFVVFYSTADGLVSGDTNGYGDVFVRDLQLGTTTRVSRPDFAVTNTNTAQANSSCFLGRTGVRYCSDDARFVVFVSAANNLVTGDTNGDQPPYHINGDDIFVRDRDLDGNGVFDEADAVGNRKTKTVRVSVTSGESQYTEYFVGVDTYGGSVSNPSISADGRYVAFECSADILSNESGTSGNNIYWRDRDNDGNGVYDESGSTGGGVDRAITRLVSKIRSGTSGLSDGFCSDPAISGNGLYVAFASASQKLDYDTVFDSDSNSVTDVYIRKMSDANTNKSQRVSLDSNEVQNSSGGSSSPSVSYTGRYVAFTSGSSQLLPVGEDTNGTTDVFVRDRGNPSGGEFILSFGSTSRVSLGTFFGLFSSNYNVELTQASNEPFISSDGRYVSFKTADAGVICNWIFGCSDSGTFNDVYYRDRVNNTAKIVSLTASDANGNGDSSFGSLSDDAAVGAFQSTATNMTGVDANGASSDVYARTVSLAVNYWRSVRTHSGTDLSIYLNATASGNGVSGPKTETRIGGIRRIELDLNGPAVLVNPGAVQVLGRTTTAGVMGGSVDYSGVATVGMVDERTMAISFNAGALPNESCYYINIAGALENSAGPLTGDIDVRVRSLYGDATSDGAVNLGDSLRVKGNIGNTAASDPSQDVNVNGGNISLGDALAVKSQVSSPPKQALCP